MKLLFIGGTGNISSECAAYLHGQGHEIFVITRGRSAVPDGYHALVADRKDADSMRRAMQGLEPEVVFNFLGYELGDVQIDYDLFKGRARQYFFISTTTVYAKPHLELPLTELSPVGNIWSEYAQKKLVCEQWLLQQRQENGFPVTIVRPSHTYSKIWIPNPVSSASFTFAARMEQGKAVFVPDDGENPWTLTEASDFATGLAGLAGNERAIGEVFHITSDEVLTWNQICREIASALGVQSPVIKLVPTDYICQMAPQLTGTLKGDKSNPGIFDNSKIKRFVPGFECKKPFRVGVRESVAFLRANPGFQNLNPQVDAMIDKILDGLKGS